ncbi:GntR family transcriptional regulator [Oerskovia sp. NPDC056781]
MPLQPLDRPLTVSSALVDGVYEVLLDAIVSGELAPGEVVKESEVGTVLGVSRTPVREAFRRLAEIDLLRIAVNRGSRVTELDPVHLAEVAQVLAELSGLAARLALPRLTDQDTAWIQDLSEHQLRAALSDGAEEYRLYGIEFLDLLVDRAGNHVLARTAASLRPHVHRLLTLHNDRLPHLELAEDLAGMATAVREDDAELLQATVRAYYRLTVEHLLDAGRAGGHLSLLA